VLPPVPEGTYLIALTVVGKPIAMKIPQYYGYLRDDEIYLIVVQAERWMTASNMLAPTETPGSFGDPDSVWKFGNPVA